jgi:hypothetical protein
VVCRRSEGQRARGEALLQITVQDSCYSCVGFPAGRAVQLLHVHFLFVSIFTSLESPCTPAD